MRLFVGIPIEGALRERIAQALRDLRERFPACRWSAPENLHLTVRFLGEINPAKLPEVERWFDHCAAQSQLGALHLTSPGSFERLDQVVFWFGLERAEWLEDCVGNFTIPVAGLMPEERGFVPHLTVGRYRISRAVHVSLRECMMEFKRLQVPEITQASVRLVLYESQLADGGPVYRELRVFPILRTG